MTRIVESFQGFAKNSSLLVIDSNNHSVFDRPSSVVSHKIIQFFGNECISRISRTKESRLNKPEGSRRISQHAFF